jgi:hypothetical protein
MDSVKKSASAGHFSTAKVVEKPHTCDRLTSTFPFEGQFPSAGELFS